MRKLLLTLALWFIAATPALASNCSPYPFTLQNGQTADANQVMANFNNVLNCANSNLAHNGANSDITSITGLTTPLAPSLGGTSVFVGGTTSGSANAQTLADTTPNSFSLTAGNRATFVAGFTNTGALTLNIKSTGATAVERRTPAGLVALSGGEVAANQAYTVEYDGTQYELLDPAAAIGPESTTNGNVPQWSGTNGATLGAGLAVGTSANNLVQLDASAKLPAVDGSQLTNLPLPTRTALTAASGTYTTPAGARLLRVRMVGGGGGGGGQGNTGGTGGTSTFGSTSAAGGSGGNSAGNGVGGRGGTGGTTGTGTEIIRVRGSDGNPGTNAGNASGSGGTSPFGGAGSGNSASGGADSAAPHSGSGGGGAGNGAGIGAGGGGSGEYVEFDIVNPVSAYSYSVGTAGAAGTNAGMGASGLIIVEAYY